MAPSMDQVLLAFPPDNYKSLTDDEYDAAINLHIERVGHLLKSQTPAIIASSADLIPILDPSINSISTLALINILKSSAEPNSPIPRPELTSLVVKFFQSFDGRQIRYVGDSFAHLIDEVVCCKWVPGPQAVPLLASAILRLDPASEMLTTTHYALATMALESREYAAALPVIEKPYVFVPGMKNQLDPVKLGDKSASPASYISQRTHLTGAMSKDSVMNYDLTCGLIFTLLRRWGEAHRAFARVVSFPTRDGDITKTMAEAYKKWLLTGLLATGTTPKLPSHVHPAASKRYNALGKPYLEVASHFPSVEVEKLMAEVDKEAKTWEEDGNIEIIKEVMAGYQQWQIISLGSVYDKLSIHEIREQTRSAETGKQIDSDQQAEGLIRDMITSGILRASLQTHPDQTTTYLVYLSPNEELSEDVFASKMLTSVDRLKALGQIVQTTDWRLMTSKDYVKHVSREQKRAERDPALDAGYGFDNAVEDEDLMVGITQG